MYERHKGSAEFFLVYISEGPHREHLPPTFPRDTLRRIAWGMKLFQISFPCLLDEGQEAEKNYHVFISQRLVVVGADGRVALDGGVGMPSGFDLGRIDAWLERHRGMGGRPG